MCWCRWGSAGARGRWIGGVAQSRDEEIGTHALGAAALPAPPQSHTPRFFECSIAITQQLNAKYTTAAHARATMQKWEDMAWFYVVMRKWGMENDAG